MAERVVVVGADAAGMSAAGQLRRRRPDVEIVALERGRWTSYSACGIPYLVGGEVAALEDLVARTPQQLRDGLRVDVRMRSEAVALDLDRGDVEVRDHEHDRTYRLGFDRLLLATGARPIRPALPGIEEEPVHGVQTLDDAAHLLEHAPEPGHDVVVVGGGYIGLELAEAFTRRGARVTLVEGGPHIMRTLDPDVADLVAAAVRRHRIDLRTGVRVEGFRAGAVLTTDGELPADLVVLGLGVEPNAELAAAAGIELGPRGSIDVDRRQRTSHEAVWAAGDCASTFHLVSQRPIHVALGTVANKAGRVAGITLAGGYATFPGVVGTAVTKVCDTEVGRTGLTELEAAKAGFEVVTGTIRSTVHAGYLPDAHEITVKLVAERGTGRLLGGQIVGGEGSAKRVDVLATALCARMTVADLVDLDLGYAPPFSGVWDPVQVAAREVLRGLGTPP